MYHISNFVKSQWLAVVLIIVFIIYSIFNTADIAKYKEERSKFNSKIDSLELLADKNKKLIDSLKQIDGVFVEKIKVIKEKEYEEIHIIDSLPANELQGYFTERYPE
jgi:hypothetical protein